MLASACPVESPQGPAKPSQTGFLLASQNFSSQSSLSFMCHLRLYSKSVTYVAISLVKPSRAVLSLKERSIPMASLFPSWANQALALLMCNHTITAVLSSACHFDQSLLYLPTRESTRFPLKRNISYPSSYSRPHSSSHLSVSSDLQ